MVYNTVINPTKNAKVSEEKVTGKKMNIRNSSDGTIDFALSYAGEDIEIARTVAQQLRELSFTVFLADEQRYSLVGIDGETFFERLFTQAKQVITFISESYRAKDWTRFEWDVIRKRKFENRYIPIRLDDTRILGLSSNIIYLKWTGENLQEVVDTCVQRLLIFERDAGIKRPTMYERILAEMQYGSRGALAKAYQLVKDGRERDPLSDAEMPMGPWTPQYEIVESRWFNFSRVKRRGLKVRLPKQMERDELVFNLKHCCIKEFNDLKPDAVSVGGYSLNANIDGPADLAILEFAPFGDWGKAEEGVAYNLPTVEFDFNIRFMRNV
jgi:hypothetical protein